jgi:6-phosphogluconolactonase (cycloisomerase 2 family)
MTTGNPLSYPTQATAGNQPNTVAVSPNNRFMYVGSGDGTIDAYRVNSDGTLVAIGAPFANAGSARGMAVDPTGRFLYVSDNLGARIVRFSIDQTTGALTSPASFATPASAQPRGLAIDNANHLYVAFAALNQVGQYAIDGSGALTPIAPGPIAAGTTPDRVVAAPNGQAVFVSNVFSDTISIYSVGAGGALTSVGTAGTGANSRPLGLAIHPNGQLLVVTLSANSLTTNVLSFTVSGATLTQVGSGSTTGSTGANATGVTFDPTGQYIYVANGGNATVTKFNLSPGGAFSGNFNFATGASPQFLLSRPAPGGSGGSASVPTLSTWSLALLAMMLLGSSAFLYRRSYR